MTITDVEKVVTITNDELFQFISEKTGHVILEEEYYISDIECDTDMASNTACVRITLQK